MAGFILRRLVLIVPTLLGVLTIIFVSLRLSGDPAMLFVGQDARPEDVARVRELWGFNEPMPVQYGRFLLRAVQGDFGTSLRYGAPAMELVLRRWPATLQLSVASLLISLVLGIPLGTLAALKRGTWVDTLSMFSTLLGQGAPVFWIGVMLILIFSVSLRWLPASGNATPLHIVLPSFTLGAFFMARIARFTRTAVLDVIYQDFIRTARAKGLGSVQILWGHVARNAAIPVVTIAGLSLPSLIGGAVLTEAVFAWPGVAGFIVTGVENRDYPVVQAGVFLIAVSVAFINLVVDVLYGYIDPRVTFGAKE